MKHERNRKPARPACRQAGMRQAGLCYLCNLWFQHVKNAVSPIPSGSSSFMLGVPPVRGDEGGFKSLPDGRQVP